MNYNGQHKHKKVWMQSIIKLLKETQEKNHLGLSQEFYAFTMIYKGEIDKFIKI